MVHRGEKPYKCPICEKVKIKLTAHNLFLIFLTLKFVYILHDWCFRQSSTLSDHMLVHGDERPFSCTICSMVNP